jgi:uncharacterized membrane protein YciS (DUF1049 family)
MEKIKELLKKSYVPLVGVFIVGLLVGWFVFGYGIFKIEYKDAAPRDLRQEAKEDYLRMVIQTYKNDLDLGQAVWRWEELGEGAQKLLDTVSATNTDPEFQADIIIFRSMVLGQAAESPLAVTPGEGTTPLIPDEETGGMKFSTVLLVVLLAAFFIVGVALVYFLFIRGSSKGRLREDAKAIQKAQDISRETERTDFESVGQDMPVAQFMTTYMLGDDLYDDSFSIDSPSGEFLGECGVGISETIGVGDPKKVTAFEVWLFDKNDIQTVTKVMMSDHAYMDEDITQRLASKGEPLTISPGQRVLLETATLQLEARVVDMNYGQGALPDNSYFDRLTLELAVWTKTIQ